MLLDDLTKEIKAQLYERVKSPLFGAFAFSWVAWNYRALLGAVSELSFKERMAYLDALYPTWQDWGWHCFAGPLLTAVVFLLAYPWPARGMYRYWANQHKKLKKVQQEIEDETPLTQEEARGLRKASLAMSAELEAEIAKQRQLVKELNERLRLSAEDTLRVTTERDQFSEAAKKAQEELSGHMAGVLQTELPLPQNGALAAVSKAGLESSGDKEMKADGARGTLKDHPVGLPLSQPTAESLRDAMQEKKSVNTFSDRVFRMVCNVDGGTAEEIAGALGFNEAEVSGALMELAGKNLVVRNGKIWGLSPRGQILKPIGGW